jgi:hypothetical protein
MEMDLDEAAIYLSATALRAAAGKQGSEGHPRRVVILAPFALHALLQTPEYPLRHALAYAFVQALRMQVRARRFDRS